MEDWDTGDHNNLLQTCSRPHMQHQLLSYYKQKSSGNRLNKVFMTSDFSEISIDLVMDLDDNLSIIEEELEHMEVSKGEKKM